MNKEIYYTIQIKTRDSNDWNTFNINTTSDITPKQVKELTKEQATKLMNKLEKEFNSFGCLFKIQKI